MKITSRSHYGVQVLTDLAVLWGKGPVPLSKIANRSKLSQTYLEQLMLDLRRHNLVRSQRGPRGGYLLSRDPAKISFGEIIQALEGKLAPVFCISNETENVCPTFGSCRSKKVWRKIQRGFLETLNSLKLKEVLE